MNRKTIFLLGLLIPSVTMIGPAFAAPSGQGMPTDSQRHGLVTREKALETRNTYIVGVNALSIQGEPFMDSETRFKLTAGETVSVIETMGDWYRLKLEDGRSGWTLLTKPRIVLGKLVTRESKKNVSERRKKTVPRQRNDRQYLEPKEYAMKTEANEVETDNRLAPKLHGVSIREEANPDSPIKFSLEEGETVSVIETKGEWCLLRLEDGRTGWALLSEAESLLKKSIESQESISQSAAGKAGPKDAEGSAESQKGTSPDETPKVRSHAVIQLEDNGLMSLNYLDVDIREALSALAMEREINIATSKDVSGKVSVHLYQVTLEKALEAITLAGGFSYLKHGDLHYVYKPKEEKDPQAERVQMRIFKLEYAEIEKVQEILDAMPGMRMIKIHEPSKSLIVEDTPENIRKIEALINYWDKMPKQVMIEAKILKVTLKDQMSLGVNWEKILGDARIAAGGLSSATLPTPDNIDSIGGISPVPEKGSGIFANIITRKGSRRQFTAALDALKTKTKVDILSTPKILAIHGKPARVQVGGQRGYKVTTVSDGIISETIQFIDTGTILEITPYIDDEGNILLNVLPSINSVNLVEDIPVVDSTTVSTWLLAKDGETVFIGGLIEDEKTNTRRMIPCLGGIPALGALFANTLQKIDKRELVVLITPTIVKGRLRRSEQEAIEKTKKMGEKLKKEPLPHHKQVYEFFFPPK